VERERVLVGARRVKEVDYRTQSQDQVVVLDRADAVRHDPLCAQINTLGRSLMERDVIVAVQQLANWKPHFCGPQLIGGHLVEQRLESVIVTFVNDRNPDVGIAQFFERADATEPGAYDHYMIRLSHCLGSFPSKL